MKKEWQAKAEANTKRWGVQSMETVCLCMTEELGELVQAVLLHRERKGSIERVEEELVDLSALCIQMVDSIKEEQRIMKEYRKKPEVFEAERWFEVTYDREAGHGSEEKDMPIYHLGVGYFRRPDIPGTDICCLCGKTWHVHGYIADTNRNVCPGDYILKVNNEFIPCHPYTLYDDEEVK
jgi:NTP pyrophosphatase (non-canonical NTP hydrolase)